MAVIERGKLRSLSKQDMQEYEKNVIHYEQLAKKLIAIDKETARKQKELLKTQKELARRGGIYRADDDDGPALPSSFVRKERRLDALGLLGGRLEESKRKSRDEKIRPETEEERAGIADVIRAALGFARPKGRIKDTSLVSGKGAPIQRNAAFTNLVKKVDGMEKTQEAFAKIFTTGQSLVSGAQAITTLPGAISLGTGLASKIPYAAVIIALATAAYEKYNAQFGVGGTRDVRKKVSSETASLIGVEADTSILSGSRLFLSNPHYNQGLPASSSNTQDLRDGIRRFNLRKQGDIV